LRLIVAPPPPKGEGGVNFLFLELNSVVPLPPKRGEVEEFYLTFRKCKKFLEEYGNPTFK